MRTFFDATPRASKAATKTVWIFSDGMNETEEFPMPKLVEIGPERMLERAKANGLLAPLSGYEIRIYGASTAGLTRRSWAIIRRFWEMYFAAAGATLVSYSTGCDAER